MNRPGPASVALAAALLLAAPAPRPGAEPQRSYRRPSDPGFPWQWSLENRGQPVRAGSAQRGRRDADIDAVEAFAAGHTGRGTVVAIVGGGFDYRSTLAPVLWRNPGELPENGRDDDANGLVDDVIGWDFGEMDPEPWRDSLHDRLVAEIAVAPHDRLTIAGIAPEAELMVLKIADDRGRVVLGPLPRALRYAAGMGAHVILMPWTVRPQRCGDPTLAPVEAVLRRVAEGALLIGGRPGEWPACLPEVVSVQATGPDDRPVDGPSPDVEVAAPGSDGRTLVRTSFAIGMVGGAAALLFGAERSSTPAQVRARLAATADRVWPDLRAYENGRNDLFGAGRINVSRALRTDFDDDGVVDADDPDADGDGILDAGDACPLDSRPECPASGAFRKRRAQ